MEVSSWIAFFIIAFVIIIIPIAFATIVRGIVSRSRERRREAVVRQTVLQHGLRPIPDHEIPPLAKKIMWPYRLADAREELVNEKVERAFSLRVGGREAIFSEWSYGIISSYVFAHGGGHVYQRAYLVLCPGIPDMLIVPKGAWDEPANSVDFPEDASFSKTFWVEGRDKEAVRRFLGPEMRGFLLLHGPGSTLQTILHWTGMTFQAGPEGAALVRNGRTPTTELSQMATILESLAVATEAGARRVKAGGS